MSQRHAPLSEMHTARSAHSGITRSYCRDLAACDVRRGVTNSESARKKATA